MRRLILCVLMGVFLSECIADSPARPQVNPQRPSEESPERRTGNSSERSLHDSLRTLEDVTTSNRPVVRREQSDLIEERIPTREGLQNVDRP